MIHKLCSSKGHGDIVGLNQQCCKSRALLAGPGRAGPFWSEVFSGRAGPGRFDLKFSQAGPGRAVLI